ncbi:MAG TPA: hypothetical protein PKN29_11880 [Candidatus Ozemobacteraceae bacterium]|nr:hypothetical protein [Candidatus Ozemobacteraceae bacterium]
MNIDKSHNTVLNPGSNSNLQNKSNILETGSLRSANLADWLKKEKPPEAGDSFTLNSRPAEGMFNLEPVERYRYMLNQAKIQANPASATNDPKQAIKEANEIINNAMMPPGKDNPDMAELTRALQIKQMMQGRLDIAA